MKVAILVPWRTDDGHRARIWSVCRSRWEALFPRWAIYEGMSPDGPFNRSAAINNAAKQAGDWDVGLIIDADVMLGIGNVKRAVERTAKTGKVTWAHRRWRQISQEDTQRLLDRPQAAGGMLGSGGLAAPEFTADLDLIVDKTTRLSWSCCIAVRRDAWETIGGFDERFVGWGFEDSAFAATAAIVGWDRIEADVLNFWHPRTRGAGRADRDSRNRYTPQALYNARLGMRYMVALRRDFGLSDRPETSDAAVLQRDIGNLRKQDDEFRALQHPDARAAFDDLWPTIEDLRDAAREHRIGPAPSVTVVVHTGGSEEAWLQRSAYLRQSLASITEKVTGPITQRVVYSDWGPDHLEELREIADQHGFYVAGDGHHGYTGSMKRMWRYLERRAKGEYIFQAEDDFLYTRPVDLMPMILTLQDNAHLVQVALLRDAFYQDEQETGGILGWPEPSFTRIGANGTSRMEHRNFFTANPSLFRKSLTLTPWPEGRHSETLFGNRLFLDPRARAAFWGSGEEWVKHIGAVRAGTGY